MMGGGGVVVVAVGSRQKCPNQKNKGVMNAQCPSISPLVKRLRIGLRSRSANQ